MSNPNISYINQINPAISLKVRPVAGRIGAIIEGIKLSPNLDDESIKAIKAALNHHKVIFFRDQHHLDNDSQESFAALLGQPIVHPTVPAAPNSKTILELNSDNGAYANSWHTDVTFVTAYPKASILRGVVIPEAGGDTVWANTETAYDDLSDTLKAIVRDLKAIHSNQFDYADGDYRTRDKTSEQIDAYRKVFASTVYEAEHPVVRVHPETGRPSLLLGHFFRRFSGLSVGDSLKLFEILQAQVTRLENTVRWAWKVGDVAVWDNRATQHYAIADYGTQKRIVRRVTLQGDIPIGLNGELSRQLKPISVEAIPDSVAAE